VQATVLTQRRGGVRGLLPNTRFLRFATFIPPGVPHWQVFGFSKDFCMSGFRVGCIYTRNATLLQAMSNVAYFPAASNLTQHALTALLEDTRFIVRPQPARSKRKLVHVSRSESVSS
jgi:aspartate/methionine/tyrosine aminotransferase